MPKHQDTPKRCRIKGVIEYCRAHQINVDVGEVAEFFEVSRSKAYATLNGEDRSRNHSPTKNETRDRNLKLTGAQIAHADRIIEESELDLEGKGLSWGGLGVEVGTDAHPDTVRTTCQLALNDMILELFIWQSLTKRSAHKRIVVVKMTLPTSVEKERMKFAQAKLQKIDNDPENWKKVRFSDKIHAAFASEGARWIIRKFDTRLRPDNIQRVDQVPDENRPRKHVWWMVGWNYKSSFHFYTISSNKTGKMTNKKYVEILNAMVKPCLEAGEDFILEEDRDGAHGTNAPVNGMIRKWKRDNNLKTYFNAPASPDLSVIETCTQSIKQHLRKQAITDEETLEEYMWEAWGNLKQEYINEQILSMPRRLRDCIAAGGSMTGW